MATGKLGKCITYNSFRQPSSISLFPEVPGVSSADVWTLSLDLFTLFSAAEFVLYKLKELGKISQEDLSSFLEEFDRLDVDQSGTLSAYDLTLAQTNQWLLDAYVFDFAAWMVLVDVINISVVHMYTVILQRYKEP